jgi:xylulokinase
MRDSLEIIREMGIPVRQIRASGGGARSPFWRQLQADVYNHPVVTINASEGPAFGVALVAGVGAGVWKSVEEACRATIKVTSTTRVNRKRAELYERHYRTFRSLYPALKSSFADIARLVS